MPSSNTSGFILTHLVEIFVTQAHMFLSSLKTSTAQRERTYRITAKRTSFCCKPPVDTDRWLTFFTSSTPERPTKTTIAADCWPHHRGWMGGSVWSLGKAIVPIHIRHPSLWSTEETHLESGVSIREYRHRGRPRGSLAATVSPNRAPCVWGKRVSSTIVVVDAVASHRRLCFYHSIFQRVQQRRQ